MERGARETVRTLRTGLSRLAYGNPLYTLTLGRNGPRDLLLVPPDPWPGDAEKGSALLGGCYAFAGQTVRSDAPLWSPVGAGPDFVAQLHGFDWLRDLRALSGDAARRQARFLVGHWIDRHDRWDGLTWRPDILGARIANWLGGHDFFCASADDQFRLRMFASLSRQATHLARAAPGDLAGAPLLVAAKGLVYSALCLPGDPGRLEDALRILDRELRRQVLADGGHIQRNPDVHLTLLRHLIDLRGLLRLAHLRDPEVTVPESLQHAIDRMTPALRFHRHGDGLLCLFNGSGEADRVMIDAVMTHADAKGRPLKSARHSGLERIQAGRALVLMDAGDPPPPGFDPGAHAGTLSFELSFGRERMIVNCGPWPGPAEGSEGAAWAMALRGTAAHSTVTVADRNSSALIRDGGLERRAKVTLERSEIEGDTLIDASHDGYRPELGVTHRRRLYVSAEGDDVRGEDSLEGPADLPFDIRFHLHPDVRVSAVQSGEQALIRLPSGVGFRLYADGAPVKVEESVYFGAGGERRRSQQIVLSGVTDGQGAPVKWAIRQEPRG